MSTVHLESLRRSFGGTRVIDGLNLSIPDGQLVALLGRSGSGKSTLVRILAGLDDGYEAEVLTRPDSLAVAFQEPRLFPWLRVWRNVVFNLDVPDPRAAAERALAEVGLEGKADVWPLTLSGGQAQRVSLARALAREPRLLLLDEPFGALDALTRRSMHGLVTELWQRYRPTILLITHDVDEALALADRVLVLGEEGSLVTDVAVDRPRPRDPSDRELGRLREELLGTLGVRDALLA
ncbi:ABC transporter ATP-binding protein [Prauserella cavernicola]|uniref:ABC transporter ATP-binding protein n=1 Tax=Prauserella cavernicola TaxID=2800127 RepID=A0A934QNY1_9PSEU|nr:ABC transporter ATP-binding protein [Prauserella cavernicola]MBK1783705.1 ABC transporter ATP-binding protein [Prauserella cavernicola]